MVDRGLVAPAKHYARSVGATNPAVVDAVQPQTPDILRIPEVGIQLMPVGAPVPIAAVIDHVIAPVAMVDLVAIAAGEGIARAVVGIQADDPAAPRTGGRIRR